MPERLVVVGGDAAGMTAASQARRRRGPDDLHIVAFERGHHASYSACGIPYFVGGVVEPAERLIVRSPERFAANDIELHLRHEVTDVDLVAGDVTVAADEGPSRRVGFDTLVIATGAVPLRPPLDNVDADGIFGVQTLDDGIAIHRFIDQRSPRAAVVVGGGYVGIEMAEAMATLGIHTSVVEMHAQPMGLLDPDMGRVVADAMRATGIDVYVEEPVRGFEASNGHVEAVVTDDRTLAADVVVLGLGVEPNVELAQAAGIEIGPSGAIAVDRRMRTSREGVYAAGDCAEKFHRVSRERVSIPLGTHANKEGRVIGINVGGGYATFPGVIGTATSKICNVEVARTGLNESEAAAAGFDAVSATVDSTTRASYFPGAGPVRTKLVVEARSGRLLGGQIVGEEGAAKRIDVLASMIWNEMTVDEIVNVDLSYAPPFSPLWDPVLIAARKAWERVEESLPGVR